MSFLPTLACSSVSDESFSLPKPTQLGYNPPEELFGLEVELKPRKDGSPTSEPRSWFGPTGQYIRELPCPSCRGRGYTPCTECGIGRSRSDCPKCSGKGIVTCHQCSGDRVTWEEAIDEQPWERARSSSPLKVQEDDEVDNLDIKLDVKKKSKRVYQSPSPEVGLKISRSLKSLNAKTGLFSKRMKIIHRDPKLHAQRVAAIKKTRGTPAARKHTSNTMKAFFSDPENRQKRSIAMKGVNFFCQNCGREGHRRHYCPELNDSSMGRQFTCGLCGEKGHNRRTCSKLKTILREGRLIKHYRCKICRQYGHNRRTCPQVVGIDKRRDLGPPRPYKCRLCHKKGHNVRTCPRRSVITQHPED
ncbi:DNA-binding protein HEXBP [Senna tora]|uniref:DNA-binding protein HEXBP n=1 Tax=Senna tora TaxID=362788 RepID=A0A834W4J5_9FABA|nr:DNA-binding protein HEXBP [Senna tora]